jgi:hypothetical protein
MHPSILDTNPTEPAKPRSAAPLIRYMVYAGGSRRTCACLLYCEVLFLGPML